MRRFSFLISLICLIGAAVSCGERDLNSSYWGQTKFYKSFLWSKSPIDTLTRVLEVGFNEDAKKTLAQPLVLALYKVDASDPSDAQPLPPDDAKVFVDGRLSEDNTISLDKNCSGSVRIGVVLTEKFLKKSNKDRDYTLVFKVIQNPGLDRINDLEVTGNTPVLIEEKEPWTPMKIHIDQVANKLRVGTNTGLVIILIALATIVFLSRMNNLPFGVKRLYLINDNTQRTINLRGAGRVIFTKDRKKQSFLQRIFKRKTIFVTDDFFSSGDVLVEPKFRITTESGRRNGVRVSAKNYSLYNNVIVKDEEEILENIDTNNKIIIKIQ